MQMKPIVLLSPYVTPEMRAAVARTLETRWIGQGPGVERFESDFQAFFGPRIIQKQLALPVTEQQVGNIIMGKKWRHLE